MNDSKLIERKKTNNSKILYERLYKGACVKIKNSKKTFQVIGLDQENKMCWLREWPLNSESKKSFALQIKEITLQIFCSNH